MKLLRTEKKDHDSFLFELEENFIEDERRDRAAALEVLSKKEYTAYSIYDGNALIGFITVWELSGFAFIEHFVIKAPHRNKGYGADTLELIKKKFTRVVLEAEIPVEDIQKRRIEFYKRCGFVKNDFDYLQPAYRKGGEKVPLVLMSYPEKLDAKDAIISQIYEKVYSKKYI